MRINDSGPTRVSVEFSRGDNDVNVEATCSGGIPLLSSSESGD
jgi:hypothetical protein